LFIHKNGPIFFVYTKYQSVLWYMITEFLHRQSIAPISSEDNLISETNVTLLNRLQPGYRIVHHPPSQPELGCSAACSATCSAATAGLFPSTSLSENSSDFAKLLMGAVMSSSFFCFTTLISEMGISAGRFRDSSTGVEVLNEGSPIAWRVWRGVRAGVTFRALILEGVLPSTRAALGGVDIVT